MNPGLLNRSIIIERRNQTPDGAGGFTNAWVTFLTSYAAISPASAREKFFAEKLEHDVTHMVTMRWRAGVTADMRVKYVSDVGTRYLQIRGITNPGEDGRFLKLLCQEGPGS